MPTPRPTTRRRTAGFSLIELVIVVVIIGIIGAIAIPRLSRGADGANHSKLKQDLAVMNKALDLYAAEHGGRFPDAAKIANQFTQYTDLAGNTSATRDAAHSLGPYLRKVPPAPGGPNAGETGIAASHGAGVGWIYNATDGRIYLNRGVVVNEEEEDTALGRLLDAIGL
ncbi:prepilin-type N-terminal cleavage/methylation domain-containing protein [Phycisphaeraceae bacterium D3-23]